MRKLIVVLVVASAVGLQSRAALAQSAADRFYTFGGGGFAKEPLVEAGASQFGGGTAGGGAGVVIGRHLAVEGVVDNVFYERDDWPGWEGNATSVRARGLILFGQPASSARFMLIGGLGQMRDAYHYPKSYSDPGSALRFVERTFRVIEFGAGVNVNVKSAMFVRPEWTFLIGENAFGRAVLNVGWKF